MKAELYLSTYATKSDLKNETGVKSNVDKLDIDKLKNVRPDLSSLRNKVDKLDVDKLVPVPIYLSSLSGVVKNDVVRKYWRYYTITLHIIIR